MGLFTGVGDFFRGVFGEDDEEKKRRKQREAQAAAQRQQQAQTRPQNNPVNQPKVQNVNQLFGNKKNPADPLGITGVTAPKPLFQQMQEQSKAPVAPKPATQPKAPLPDQQFTGISEGEGKNKTIFGWNAAALLPKDYEKKYEVKADRTITTNKDKYVAQFDKLHPDYQKVLVNAAKEKAKSGDQAAINTLQALKDTGRLEGNVMDFIEGSNERFLGGVGRGLLRTTDFVLPGKNTWGLEQLADEQDAKKQGKAQITQAGKAGEIAGTVQKGITDLATIVLPQSKIDKLAEANTIVKTLEDGSKLMNIAGKVVKIIPGSLAGSTIDYVQQRSRGDEANLTQSAGMGLGLDLAGAAAPGAFRGVKKFFGKNKVTDKVIEDVLQEATGATTTAASKAVNLTEDNTPAFMRGFGKEKQTAQELYQAEQSALRGEGSTFREMQDKGLNPGELEDIPAYKRRNAEDIIKNAEDEIGVINSQLDQAPEQTIEQFAFNQRKKLAEDIAANPSSKDALISNYKRKMEAVNNLDALKEYRGRLEARKQELTKLVEDTRQVQAKTEELVQKQAAEQAVATEAQQKAVQEAQDIKAAQTTPPASEVVQDAPTTGSPEVEANNDAYARFNEEAGITSGSQDVDYVTAQQQLEKMAGNKTMDDLTGRQALRIPDAINKNTQGKVADAVSDTAGTLTGKLLTSQNPAANFFGQTLYGLNKKSTLNNAQKTLVEQVRGRQGGVGNLTEQVVSNIEAPLKTLDETAQANIKEKVFKAFELYNNGEPDTALVIIKSFTPEERAYFDGVRKLNILRNNLNRDTMAPELIEKYANGMHMPRLFDFTDDSVEAYAQASGRTLDLNPNKRRKQLEELSQELQQKMLRDPAQASAIRTDVALHNKAVSDYAASVSQLPGAVSDEPARGFLLIPDQPKYGNAAGKYVRRDLAEPMLSGDNRFKSESYKAVNKLLDGYQTSIMGKVENGLRKALTIYNPATRLGNRGANLTQGAMAGFNLPEMAVSQQHFMNVLKNGGDEWTRLAKTFGAIDDNTALARFSGAVNPDAGGITKGLTQSYENVDNAAKVAMFKWRIQKGATPEDAARFVNRALPNIGNSGEIYSFFSRLPVVGVPFRAIQPEVIRSVSSSASRNTIPFLVAMGTYTTLQNMSWEGVPEEERKQIQERFGAGQTPFAGINGFFGDKGIPTDKVLPSSWSFNAGKLFGKDPESGDQRVVDVDPRRLMGMYSINLGGESASDSVIDQAIKASPANIPVNFNNGDWNFAPQNIVSSRLFSPAYQAAIDRDFRGKSVQDPEGKIYNPDGTVSMKYMNPETGKPEAQSDSNRLMQFLLRSYIPQTNDVANLKDAKDGKENFYGQKMNLPQAVSRLFGLKGEEFTDQRLQDMRDTTKYFNEKAEIDKQVEGLSAQDAEAYKRLTGYYKLRDQKVPNEFAPGEMRDTKAPQYEFSEDKWKEYAAHPNLYQLMVDKKQRQNATDGTPIQPEFDSRLSEEFRKQIIQNKMVAPGDDAELDQRMYSSPEWDYYQQLKKQYTEEASKYYPDSGNGDYKDELVKHQDAKFPDKPDILKAYSAANALYYNGKSANKPEFTDQIKAAKEEYNKQTFMWTNKERAARGLPAIVWDMWNNPTFGYDETPSGFGFGFGNGNYNPADHVNMTTELTNYSQGIKRLNPIEAEAMPNIVALFQKLRAGSGGGRRKPTIGASSRGQG